MFLPISVCLAVRPYVCLTVHSYVRVCLGSVRPSVCLFFRVWQFVDPSGATSICHPAVRPSVCLSVRLDVFICASISLSVSPALSVRLSVHLSSFPLALLVNENFWWLVESVGAAAPGRILCISVNEVWLEERPSCRSRRRTGHQPSPVGSTLLALQAPRYESADD